MSNSYKRQNIENTLKHRDLKEIKKKVSKLF